jgi:ribosomal protein L44E
VATITRMTKTEARKLARKARQYGHYQEGRTLYVFCPLCRKQAGTEISRYSPGSPMQQLDASVIEHLTEMDFDDVPTCRGRLVSE